MIETLENAGLPSCPPYFRHKLPTGVGVGLKQQHIAALLANPASVDFVEVHAENFMAMGQQIDLLVDVSKTWPLSLHGVALSIGGEEPIDIDHLSRIKQLVDTVNPASFSEHIAWSRYDGSYFNDLLPIPYSKESLTRLWERVDQIQQYLGRRILLENPSSYVRFRSDTLHEADFIAELVHRTGCGILLDINNLYVSAKNHGWDTKDWLSRIQLDAVGEVHLAGYETDTDDKGARILVDTHGETISEPVWSLYCDFLAVAGKRPTLIERDNNIPPLGDLLKEVEQAKLLLRAQTETPA